MSIIVIARQPQAQQAVKGQTIEVVLEDISMLRQGIAHLLPAILLPLESKMVGFPVNDVVTTIVFENHSHEAEQHAPRLVDVELTQQPCKVTMLLRVQ